jgi:hypothetical protein
MRGGWLCPQVQGMFCVTHPLFTHVISDTCRAQLPVSLCLKDSGIELTFQVTAAYLKPKPARVFPSPFVIYSHSSEAERCSQLNMAHCFLSLEQKAP